MENLIDPEIAKTIWPALIGAVAAIVSILIKDFYLERKRERRELIDKKLSNLYGPLYMVSVTGGSTIATFLSDDLIFEKLITNMHLLSSELNKLLNEYNELGRGDYRNPQFSGKDGRIAVEISVKFSRQLESEFNELRNKYYK